MTHLLITSVHRITTGRSGEAVHLRQLAAALRDAGERVTVLDGPMDPGRAAGGDEAARAAQVRQLERLLARDRPRAALLWGHRGEETPLAERLTAAGVPLVLEHPAADIRPVSATLRLADQVVVPSRFAQELLASQTGVRASAIEPCLRPCDCPPDQAAATESVRPRRPRLTFVNPEPAKGLGVVMHLVAAVWRANLPMRFRFCEGRWTAADLARYGIDVARLPGVEVAAYRTDTCGLYAETDLLLVPSLWQESFGMVAREAVVHGVPVVASRVGGLPEAVGDGGVCLEPPAYGANYQVRMTGDEIRAWLTAVVVELRRGRRPQPALLAHARAASVAAYRALLGAG